MSKELDSLFEQILKALQSAEKRHRAIYEGASDNNDWETVERELAIIPNITRWRRTLDTLRADIGTSEAIIDNDICVFNNSTLNDKESDDASIAPPQAAEMPSRMDDERIGQYIWQKMCDLSQKGHKFTEQELTDLQNANWSYRTLNLPFPFFIKTTEDVRYYWKRDTFTFNGAQFRLCMLWYNDLYRGRSQREYFDVWYNNLESTPILQQGQPTERSEDDSEDIKIGAYIRQKIRELSSCGHVFNANDIVLFQQKRWSKEMFGLDHPFARVFDANQELSVQTKDDKGYNRYWNEAFSFGSFSLLICSQWYANYREQFDRWYNDLPQECETVKQPEQIRGNANATKPIAMTILKKRYNVHDWNELYVKFCEVMLLHRPYIMAAMDKDVELNSEELINFSYLQSEIKYNGKRLSNGLWIETNKSQESVWHSCQEILKKCGFPLDKLQVETMEV